MGAGGPRATPPLLPAGVAVNDGEGKPNQRERRDSNPSAAIRARPLVHSQQVSPQEARRRWPDSNFDVPVRMSEAVETFFLGSPTPGLIVAGILSVAALRILWCGDAAPLGLADAVAVPIVAVGWTFQEWAVHKYLLHGLENWLGHDVHEDHHDKPYYHVCVDPPDLVAGWTLAAACVFNLVLPLPMALTVLAAYMSMGLVYEWVHFFVHTRVVPRSQLGKELKRHHTLHHLKDERCWLAFTAPPIDKLFGTLPPSTPKERAASTAAAAAAAASAADMGEDDGGLDGVGGR
eukprot:g10583.t1